MIVKRDIETSWSIVHNTKHSRTIKIVKYIPTVHLFYDIAQWGYNNFNCSAVV